MIEKVNLDDRIKIGEIENKFPKYFTNDKIEQVLKNNQFRVIFSISDEKEVVGILILDIIYERMELIEIEILEDRRNLGYGNELIKFMLKKALSKHLQNITLEVKATNNVAIHLYEKYGFKKIAIRKNYYQGIDGILMERKMM